MSTRMQQRRGTASQWISTNSGNGPILAAGEIGFESDTNKFKIGDGVNHWVDLTYFTDAASAISAIEDLIAGAPTALDTLNELAAAINDDPNFFTTIATNLSNHQSDTTSIHGIDDTAELATKAFAASLLTGATKTNITITGDKTGLTITAENGVADSTTDNLSEGSTNKYFTDERAQDAVGNSVGTGLSYNDSTGAVSVDTTAIQAKVSGVTDTEIGYLDGVTSAIQTQLDDKSTASKTETLTNKTLTTPTINGPTITATGQTPTIHGIYLPAPHNIIFEGTTADDFETTLQAGEPTGDRTITLPDATGTVALTSDITTAINNLVDGAPAALDTLNELAAAINDDASYASTITTALGTKIAKADITAKGVILVGTGSGTYAAQSVGTNGQVLTANSAQADGVEWTTISGYSAPTLGSTSIASGATVTTVAGLTLTAPTLTGTVIASGDINLSAAGGPGSVVDELTLILMGAI